MRYFLMIGILGVTLLFAGKGLSGKALAGGALEVSADRFTHVEAEHKAVFEGHAHAVQGKSRVDADRFIVYFDKRNNAREYRAIGHVRFEIVRPDQHVKGHCAKLTYRVQEETYRLKGGARLTDLLNHREMQGEEIFLDNKKKLATAKSDKKGPVKFIFQMKKSPSTKKKESRR